jgi:hypothetical protein
MLRRRQYNTRRLNSTVLANFTVPDNDKDKMEIKQEIIDWLMDSDPAIRWQVMRDLLHLSQATYTQERATLEHDGWCAKLLNLQDEDGLWNRSLYDGKWISTTYTLYLLKLLGLPPTNLQALKGCDQLLTHGLYEQQEIRFSRKMNIRDLGVTAIVLSICCYFDFDKEHLPPIAGFLIDQQCDKGNWLPNRSPSAVKYTFETTLLVLEALLQYRNRFLEGQDNSILDSVERGQEFLLRHYLYLDKSKPIKSRWTTFSFPPYWFYDVLTAMDYFQSYRQNKDTRIQAGIDLLKRKQKKDGTWILGARHPGKTHFEMEKPGGPSRWNTLRALRVLDWWQGDNDRPKEVKVGGQVSRV